MKRNFKKFLSVGLIAGSVLSFSQSAFAAVVDNDGFGPISQSQDRNNTIGSAQYLGNEEYVSGFINYDNDKDIYYFYTGPYDGGRTISAIVSTLTTERTADLKITKGYEDEHVPRSSDFPDNKTLIVNFAVEPNTRYNILVRSASVAFSPYESYNLRFVGR
ncbi:hypothetical protein [Paenibacillus chitinolyticus]|uniref:hypothetical protein n=1 Tax=Paenibacillus chitinolyticus TaxID=79263 RepID=UPI003CFDEA42